MIYINWHMALALEVVGTFRLLRGLCDGEEDGREHYTCCHLLPLHLSPDLVVVVRSRME